MNEILKILSIAILTMSAFIHYSTFFPSIEISMDLVFFMHPVVILLFIVMFIQLSRLLEKIYPSPPFGSLYEPNKLVKNEYVLLKKMVPKTIIYVFYCLFVYALINFTCFLFFTKGGEVHHENSSNYLQTFSGTTPLSDEEYRRFKAYEVRGFSGHWLIFSFLPVVFFVYKKDFENKIK